MPKQQMHRLKNPQMNSLRNICNILHVQRQAIGRRMSVSVPVSAGRAPVHHKILEGYNGMLAVLSKSNLSSARTDAFHMA